MKILILIKKWPGGVGVVVKNVRNELEKKGHKVAIISREEDMKIYSLRQSIFPIRRKVKQLMKKERYNIIYTQDWSMALPLFFPFSAYRKKHFCCFHGNQIGKTRSLQTIVGKTLGKKLIVVGGSLKKRFPKSNLIYNGVDLDKFKPLKKRRDSLGWINKGTEILTKKEIISLAKKLKLKSLIAENFSIPFDKMNEEFYNKLKIFVSLPPVTAGFNLCWIEAMASGVPVIIGNNEGIGNKIQIDKVKSNKELFESVKKFKGKDYRKEIEKSGLTWKNYTNKLLEIWRR